jgi:transcription initiation factor TFIIB
MARSKPELGRLCPSCSSPSLLEDEETGEVVCTHCGHVVTERQPVSGEARLPKKEGISPERVGPPPSLLSPDLGLATEIERREGAGKLRALHRRTVYAGKVLTLAGALKVIRSLSEKLNLSQTTAERAAYIYRSAVKAGMLVGVSARRLAIAATYAACRESGIPRSLEAVAGAAGIPEKKLTYEYRRLVSTLDLRTSVVQPERYLPKIADQLDIDEPTRRSAYSVLARAERNGLSAGKEPKGLAAAALLLACEPLPRGMSRERFARAAGVTTVTLRKRVKDLEKYAEAVKE